MLNGNYIRLESEHREDIFNIDMNKVKEYQILHKIFAMSDDE